MTRVKKGSKVYLNFYNGIEKVVTDDVYQSRFSNLDFDKEIRKIFEGTNFKATKIHFHNSSSEHVYKLETKTGKIIYICSYILKNSGQDTSRKRLQIYPNYYGFIKNNVHRNEDEIYFFLGLYPINSNGDFVYVLLDNDGVSLNPLESYSSLWVDYEAIKATIINGFYFGINKNNANKYFCFRKDYKNIIISSIEDDDYSSIIKNKSDIHFIDKSNKETTNTEVYIDDYVPSRDAVVTIEGKAKIKKNSALREIVFLESEYKCDLCGKENTFITNNDKMYFEAHHLIPCNINVQKKFKKKLDHVLNMFCLCPECHRKIHLIKSSNMSCLLEALFVKRKTSLSKEYNLDLVNLIEIYNKIDRKDEENM